MFWVDEEGNIKVRLHGDQPLHKRALLDFAHETTTAAKEVSREEGLDNVYAECFLGEDNINWDDDEDDDEEEDYEEENDG